MSFDEGGGQSTRPLSLPNLWREGGGKPRLRQLFARPDWLRNHVGRATLDKFIANPDEVVANNNMKPYKGTSDAAVRKKIIEFLKSSSAGS